MRYRLPEGTAALSHDGQVVPVAPDGTIELAADAVASLASHGVEPAATDPARPSPRRANAKPVR